MKWTKRELGILSGCIVLIVCLLLYGFFIVSPEKRRENVVKAVLERMYVWEDPVLTELRELVEKGIDLLGEGVTEEDMKEAAVRKEEFDRIMEERFGEYFTEKGLEAFKSAGYDFMYGYCAFNKGIRFHCEKLDWTRDAEKEKHNGGELDYKADVVRENADGTADKIVERGGVRFDKNDKIEYWIISRDGLDGIL